MDRHIFIIYIQISIANFYIIWQIVYGHWGEIVLYVVVARRFCPCLAQDICQKLLPCFAA